MQSSAPLHDSDPVPHRPEFQRRGPGLLPPPVRCPDSPVPDRLRLAAPVRLPVVPVRVALELDGIREDGCKAKGYGGELISRQGQHLRSASAIADPNFPFLECTAFSSNLSARLAKPA